MKVIVIGSGVAGASVAYHLTKKGVETVLIDSNEEGQATAAGAGIICPWLSGSADDESWLVLAERGAMYYPELVAQLAEDGEVQVSYRTVGALAVSSEAAEVDRIEQRLTAKKQLVSAIGEIKRLSPQEAKQLFPPLRSDLSALYISGAARVDGRLLRDALKRAAVKNGADLREGQAVLKINNGQLAGAEVNGEVIRADKVVVAGGAWSRALAMKTGTELEVEPQRGQIAHILLPDVDTADWPVVVPGSGHYLVSFDDSRVVAGATREANSGFDYRLTVSGVKEVLDEALRIAPGLAEGSLDEVRIGFRPASPDGLPLLGELQTVPNVVVATGMGASGLTVGPYAGKLAAQLVLEEKVEIDLSPYNPTRRKTAYASSKAN